VRVVGNLREPELNGEEGTVLAADALLQAPIHVKSNSCPKLALPWTETLTLRERCGGAGVRPPAPPPLSQYPARIPRR